MAVVQLFDPNLNGAYANIQNALSQRADITSQLTGGMGAMAAAAQPLAAQSQLMQKYKMDRTTKLWEATLEDQLNKNKSQYAAQAEGKELTTSEEFKNWATQHGVDAKGVDGLVPKQGVWLSPDQKVGLQSTLKRSQIIEGMALDKEAKGDKVGANLMRLMGRSNDPQADQWIARLNGISQVESYVDPVTKTTKYRDKLTKMPLDVGSSPGAGTSDGNSTAFETIPALRRVDQRQADALDAAGKQAITDPLLKQHAQTLDELKQVEKLIKANVAGSQINVGADTARAVGGVPGGRFTAMVAMREGKDPSLLGRLGQGYSTVTAGNYSENNQKLLLQEIDVARKNQQQELNSSLEDKIQQVKVDAPYASEKLIRSRIGGNYARYLNETSSKPPPEIMEVKSQGDYDKLKSGDQYLWKGKVLTKK